jgi:hypothetical protein
MLQVEIILNTISLLIEPPPGLATIVRGLCKGKVAEV